MSADGTFYVESDNLVQLTGLKDAETDEYINDATVVMSLFHKDEIKAKASTDAAKKLAFTSGGTYEIKDGDLIEGNTSGAKAYIQNVIVTSGTWGGGDAAGDLWIYQQSGTFQSETLKVGANGDVATISGDSDGTKTSIECTGHGLVSSDYIRLAGFINYNGECSIDSIPDIDHLVIAKTHVDEEFVGDEKIYIGVPNGTKISMTHEGGDADGYYDAILPDTLKGVLEYTETSTLAGMVYTGLYYLFVEATKGSSKVTIRLLWQGEYSAITA